MARNGDRSMPSGGSPYSRSAGVAGGLFSRSAGTERLVDKSIDPESHNLHAGIGERCMICDRVIAKGRAVRRTISGGYVHDSC